MGKSKVLLYAVLLLVVEKIPNDSTLLCVLVALGPPYFSKYSVSPERDLVVYHLFLYESYNSRHV